MVSSSRRRSAWPLAPSRPRSSASAATWTRAASMAFASPASVSNINIERRSSGSGRRSTNPALSSRSRRCVIPAGDNMPLRAKTDGLLVRSGACSSEARTSNSPADNPTAAKAASTCLCPRAVTRASSKPVRIVSRSRSGTRRAQLSIPSSIRLRSSTRTNYPASTSVSNSSSSKQIYRFPVAQVRMLRRPRRVARAAATTAAHLERRISSARNPILTRHRREGGPHRAPTSQQWSRPR